MSRPKKRSANTSAHRYPREARLNEILREVIADELTRIDDERLEFVTVTSVDVDAELNRGIVYYDSLAGEAGDQAILEVLEEHRRRIQSSIGKQVRAKKTPVLEFRPDNVIRAAERIDEVLRADRERRERARLDQD
ncbi:MAG: 30S ribosome-binding factor RbfA [Actinobacteria bacterium]|jgi:ribosome-binding factor A|nr:30S ribosome-binding factor RbfA [Actinomycetota bacterium]NBP54736.1 30S ribosome-binding factor RbfA [Actinomycetota bacterium]